MKELRIGDKIHLTWGVTGDLVQSTEVPMTDTPLARKIREGSFHRYVRPAETRWYVAALGITLAAVGVMALACGLFNFFKAL